MADVAFLYPLDEAASGTSPTSVLDIGGNAYNLTEINYGSSTLAYTETSGQRGVVSSSAAGTHRLRRSIDNTADALRTNFVGTQKATIEVVLNATTGTVNGGRIAAITDRVGGTGQLALRLGTGGNATAWGLAWNGTTDTFATDTGLLLTRRVLHVVIDSTQATSANRLKYAFDGGTLTAVSNSIALNSTLSIGSNSDLILLNREDGGSFGRSMEGTLYFVGFYNTAHDQTLVGTRATALLADDDPTGGGGGGSSTGAPTHRALMGMF